MPIPTVWLGLPSLLHQRLSHGPLVPVRRHRGCHPRQVHGGTEHVQPGCGKLLVLDAEHLPTGLGEFTQAEVTARGELFVEVGEESWPELLAWYERRSSSLDVHGMPSTAEFDEANRGH